MTPYGFQCRHELRQPARPVIYRRDNNGNLAAARQWTYAWDYRNRLTSAGNGLSTTTFGYDHNDNELVFPATGTESRTVVVN